MCWKPFPNQVFFLSALLLSGSLLSGATHYVPDDYLTIQGAIVCVRSGDTIIVRQGTYLENLDFQGKTVTVKSESGPHVTIIDGNHRGSVVTFDSGENRDSVIEGFTITGGESYYGAGIYCENSAPTIAGNIIRDNWAHGTFTGKGGGISCWQSFPLICGNTIVDNKASGNYNDGAGGGIYCSYSSPVIRGNRIIGNQAICLYGSDTGGGISCTDYSFPEITGNIIVRNSGDPTGGGIAARLSSPRIWNNVIAYNHAESAGGGLYFSSVSTSDVLCNTICTNTTGEEGSGGGIYCRDRCSLDITNTILWGNVAPMGPSLRIDSGESPSWVSVNYCDIEGGQSSVSVDAGNTLHWMSGMLDSDPRFIDPENDDFHLAWDSPCVDAGFIYGVPHDHDIDFESDPRIAGGCVDIGADEFWYHLYSTGSAFPGSTIVLKVVGHPGAPVKLALGAGLLESPVPTAYGDLLITWPPLKGDHLGRIPPKGVLILPYTVPDDCDIGTEHPLQALVGPRGCVWTYLTNAEVIVVEPPVDLRSR